MRYITEGIAQALYNKRIDEARKPKYWDSMFAVKVINAFNKGELTYQNMDKWEKDYNGGVKPNPPFNTKEILDYYRLTGKGPNESADDFISEAVDIHKINIKSVKPEKKDIDRAKGIKSVSDASKMAKLIKDPMKLIRRTKAVYAIHFSDKTSNKEDFWSPFIQAMKDMGFTDAEISELMKSYDKFVPNDIDTNKAEVEDKKSANTTKIETKKSDNTSSSKNLDKSINSFKGSYSSMPFEETSIDEISKIDLINQNKKNYEYVSNNTDKLVKDKIDREISKTLILRWIKGKNWEGGLGNGKDVDKMCDNLSKKLNIDFDDLGERFDNLCDFWEKEFKKNNI